MVFVIGFCTMAFENILYIGIAQGCRLTCKNLRNFCHNKCHKCKRCIRKITNTSGGDNDGKTKNNKKRMGKAVVIPISP